MVGRDLRKLWEKRMLAQNIIIKFHFAENGNGSQSGYKHGRKVSLFAMYAPKNTFLRTYFLIKRLFFSFELCFQDFKFLFYFTFLLKLDFSFQQYIPSSFSPFSIPPSYPIPPLSSKCLWIWTNWPKINLSIRGDFSIKSK